MRASRAAETTLDKVLDGPPPEIVYQPIVDLGSPVRAVVGYEALARWPDEGAIPTDAVFAAAAAAHRIDELDWRCRLTALEGALEVGMGEALFVNYEPGVSLATAPFGQNQLWGRAVRDLNVVLEVTERDIARRPAMLLAAVDHARQRGLRIALDDVGAHPDTLAMLEFIRPDVVKLDLSLVQSAVAGDRARSLLAVLGYCERTGAALLAEGIENVAQLERALSIGARYGQGHMLGRPAALPDTSATDDAEPPKARPSPLPRVPAASVPECPFDAVADRGGVRLARRALITALSHDLEAHAADLLDPPVILASFQKTDNFRGGPRERFARIATRSPLVVALGVDMPARPAPGVQGARIDPDDPLAQEWVLVIVGHTYSAALVARDCGDSGPEDDRRFRYALTQDRDTAVAAGRALLNRLVTEVELPH